MKLDLMRRGGSELVAANAADLPEVFKPSPNVVRTFETFDAAEVSGPAQAIEACLAIMEDGRNVEMDARARGILQGGLSLDPHIVRGVTEGLFIGALIPGMDEASRTAFAESLAAAGWEITRESVSKGFIGEELGVEGFSGIDLQRARPEGGGQKVSLALSPSRDGSGLRLRTDFSSGTVNKLTTVCLERGTSFEDQRRKAREEAQDTRVRWMQSDVEDKQRLLTEIERLRSLLGASTTAVDFVRKPLIKWFRQALDVL